MSVLARNSVAKIEGPWLDWTMALLGLVFVGGLFLDGWAHTHGKVDQSFFTPWHAVLYSGFFLNFVTLFGIAVLNRTRGSTWTEALPVAYWLSLFGMGLWFLGGPGDLLWHTLFGIEENIDALYSPTHLLLATGLVLAVSGAYRAMWNQSPIPTGWQQLPMLLSLAASLATLTFFVQFTHPVSNGWGLGRRDFLPEIYQATGVTSWIITVGILMGAMLLTMRRWCLALGAFALVLGLTAFAIAFTGGAYPLRGVVLWLGAGVLLDVLYQSLKPRANRLAAVRLFAFVAPVVVSGLYFIVGALTIGVSWSVHLTGGVIFLTGIVGLFMSLLVFPPPMPAESP